MRDEKLILTVQPKIEFGDLDSNIPTNVMNVPDDWLDGLSDLIAKLFFIENDEEFDSLLRGLEPGPAASLIEETVDPLGMYYPSNRTIKIDENKIHRCADYMQAQGAKATFDHLSKIIAIHEESHALHHLAGDPQKDNEIWDKFGDSPSYVLEMLAQLFTYHEVCSDSELLQAFYELEKRQPLVYHLWRLFSKCPKERLYWFIRDNYNHIGRIVKILQKVGYYQRAYYQVAAGTYERDYSDIFLDFGMALVGWGKGWDRITHVRPFDRIILKQGLKKIKSVGEVVLRGGKCCGDHYKDSDDGKDEEKDKGKNWLDDFDGWDLPHYCFVNWHVPEGTDCIAQANLTRSTFQGVHQDALKKQADQILKKYPVKPHKPEPIVTQKLLDKEILNFLISEGLRASSAEDFITEVGRIRLLADYYRIQCKWESISEEETKTFLVVPLLIALGWSEQQIKLEYNCKAGTIDLALFDVPFKRRGNPLENGPSTGDDHCVLIIETKRLNQGLDFAQAEAKAYAQAFRNCKAVVASNGWSYKLYLREEGQNSFEDDPSAYLSIINPTEKFPLNPAKGGAKEVFRYLLRR